MSNMGRCRLNINDTYNNRTQDVIYKNEQTINTKFTAMLILDIMNKHPKAKKVNLTLDNAKYNGAGLIKIFENHSKINLIYLPQYCPNLNLDERLLKFLYKKVPICKHYNKFVDFPNAILSFLDKIAQRKEELITLITKNFNITRPKYPNFILDEYR